MTEPKPTDDMGVNLIQAQAAIIAMLKECRLSSVKICVEDEYNRYYKTADNGGGGVAYRFESLAELYTQERPSPRYRQPALLEDEG